MAWTPTTADEANRRAGGRRRYLAQRRTFQDARRHDVLRALQAQDWLKTGWSSYGAGRALAEQLDVSEATISRDLDYFTEMRARLGENAANVFDLMLRNREHAAKRENLRKPEIENVIKRQIESVTKRDFQEPEQANISQTSVQSVEDETVANRNIQTSTPAPDPPPCTRTHNIRPR